MFVTEGPLHPESRLFVGRSAELSQMGAWLTNVRCVGAVLGARQTGKTSLLFKLRHVFKDKYAFVFVDLEAVAGADLSDCVAYIAAEMMTQLDVQLEHLDLALPTKTNEFLGFLEACAGALNAVRIVVLLDEIGALKSDTSLRLTSAIRAVFTTRLVKPAFGKYVFVIAGATNALDVTVGRNSPLKNVAETLYLGDLSESETKQLVAEMFPEQAPGLDSDLGRALHDWTNGHPYWTQRLGEALHAEAVDASAARVNDAVEQLVRTEDRNLPYVLHALDADKTLRDLTVAMVGGTPIAFTRANSAIARLELLGLLRNDRGRCAIRNRIYEKALHDEPIRPAPVPSRDLREFNEQLSDATDLEPLLQTATLAVQHLARSRSTIALAVQPRSRSFEVVSNVGGPIGPIEPAPFGLESAALASIVGCTELATIATSDAEAAWLKRVGATLIVPVKLKQSIAALYCIGPKLSGEDYGPHERDFLTSLGELTAAALDRMRLRALERDANKAWEIQRDLLPAHLPQPAGLQIAASCQPARVVSGDYYDAFELSEDIVAVCVGDVAGKGMPAALLMAQLQGTVKVLTSDSARPGRLCELVNRALARTISPPEFITFFYATLNTKSRQLHFTNAGHPQPVVVRADGDVRRLSDGGPVLGVFPEAPYEDGSITLGPGDRLVLFTDGVTEARNREGEEFGDERLISIVRACDNGVKADTLLQAIIDGLHKFSDGIFQDDVTVLVVTS